MAASSGRVCSTRSVSLFLQTLLCSCMICTSLCAARALATPAGAAGSGMREYHLRGNHMKSAYDQLKLEGRTMQLFGQVLANDTEEELSDHERRELTVYSLDDYCTRANSKHDPTPTRCP
ncbi:unnamed protein product [Sphagnum jensenii]|uniref:Uncharacterized protein n=1 Tax=Sphagnum jensenii TaxID=128206 RepID=A0ABP0X3A5_9BRYO